MTRRTRLRSRIFAITTLFVTLLFAVTVVLSWRAVAAQKQFSRLLQHETRAIALLEDVIRLQSGFFQQWKNPEKRTATELIAIAHRYRVVTQILERDELRTKDVDRIRKAAATFASLVRETSRSWASLAQADRSAAFLAIEIGSGDLGAEAARLVELRKSEVQRQVPLLERSGNNMRHAGLAVAWIIAMVSFAVARTTLSSVVRPIEDLSKAASRIAAGDLSARAPVHGDFEIAQLAQSFNEMAASMAASHAALSESARTDELTRLPNFRAFRETIAVEMARAERYGHPLGILIIDLDRFKQFNDTYGHHAGNEALHLVADAIRKATRSVDSPARYGGEEFAVLLPEVEGAPLQVAAERIRSSIAALPAVPGTRALTVSIGGAAYPADGDSNEAIFTAADARLYEAKEAGRNQSIVASKQSKSA